MAGPALQRLTSGSFFGVILDRLAAGPVGRLLAPLSPLFLALGMSDRRNRYILNIGDEGATLVQVRGGQVVDAIFAEAAAEEGWDALTEMLNSEPGGTIVIAADVLEQMFREDTVPKVGILDRAKIVRRRLDLTYPNDLLKAALPLPRTRGAPQAVLFTALPMSANLDRWVKFLDQRPNPLRGFHMLPLETVGIAERLSPPAQGENRRVWYALISQEAASGFRQVFESNGKMVVTRLTQRPSQPLTADAEAMLIERELRSSISYIKRLGFSDADRLDVVVLADPAVCRAVDDRDLPATIVSTYTPYQAGVLLGLGEVGREDTPFADVLLGLWVAAKRRATLMLPTPAIARQMTLAKITRWSLAGVVVLTLLAAYYTGSLLVEFAAGANDIAGLQADLDKANAQLASERARAASSPIPLEELTQVAESEDRLAREEVDLAALFVKVAGALGSDARATNVAFLLDKAPGAADPKKKGVVSVEHDYGYEIHINVRLMAAGVGVEDPQVGVQLAKAVLGRLSDAFPGYKVEAVKLPAAVLVSQTLEGSANVAGGSAAAKQSKELTAEYSIRKEG